MRSWTREKEKETTEKKATQRTFLLPILDAVHLVHARSEIGRVATEGDFERGQETIHTRQKRLRSTKRKKGGQNPHSEKNLAPSYGVAVAAIAG